MANGDVGPDLDRLAEMRHSLLGQAALHGDDAEQMQAAGVPGIARQHRPAERLGIEPLTELVMANGFGEQIARSAREPGEPPPAWCAWSRRGALSDSSSALQRLEGWRRGWDSNPRYGVNRMTI